MLVVWARYKIDDFGHRIGQAFAVMRPPRRWLRTVVPWQLADWALRIATIWFFLGAFGIDQSIRNALLVQVTLSLATLVPATPGGIGTEQAFLTVVLRGAAPVLGAARVQRRHAHHAHGRQRDRRDRRHRRDARDAEPPRHAVRHARAATARRRRGGDETGTGSDRE